MFIHAFILLFLGNQFFLSDRSRLTQIIPVIFQNIQPKTKKLISISFIGVQN